jgi:hypothetical protein
MHKELIFSGDPQTLRAMGDSLQTMDHVIGVSLQKGASIKPAGDVLVVHTLNRGADEVLRLASQATRAGRIEIVICSANAFIAPLRRTVIGHDIDEALWEEMESGLRNHGRISPNYLLLMFLGGVIASVALFLAPVEQAIAAVAASIIAPGFEPVAKISQGIALGRGHMVGRGALAVLAGYATLIAAAALTTLLLAGLGEANDAHLRAQPILSSLTTFGARPLLTSACAAIAGAMMVVSLRDVYVVGPLIALVLIPGAALVGVALALHDTDLALRALTRIGADIALVIGFGIGVFFWKQKHIHRRDPLE